jgi:hypothetical protein
MCSGASVGDAAGCRQLRFIDYAMYCRTPSLCREGSVTKTVSGRHEEKGGWIEVVARERVGGELRKVDNGGAKEAKLSPQRRKLEAKREARARDSGGIESMR